jgi:hypothetical protein
LKLSNTGMSRVSQVAVVGGDGQGTEAGLVGRRVTDGVQHAHVTDVVDEQRLLQADHETLKKEHNF